jgi:hypothetical protein
MPIEIALKIWLKKEKLFMSIPKLKFIPASNKAVFLLSIIWRNK